MKTRPPPPRTFEPPHAPQLVTKQIDPPCRTLIPLHYVSDAAAAPVAGSKRPTGNDLFREKLMAASVLSQPSSSSSTAVQTKRQALGADDGVGETSDWQELSTHQNHTYFLHVPTGRGQWNRPALLADVNESNEVCNAGVDERTLAAAAGEGQGGSSAAADDPATYVDVLSCFNQKL